uniref:Uncharacterized protein n=1 Tax=Dulem virus 213 TaxID=3145690 RepID=A0AAU8B603_9VIRU
MVIKLKFNNALKHKKRSVKVEVSEECLYALLVNERKLISIVEKYQKENEYIIGINDND